MKFMPMTSNTLFTLGHWSIKLVHVDDDEPNSDKLGALYHECKESGSKSAWCECIMCRAYARKHGLSSQGGADNTFCIRCGEKPPDEVYALFIMYNNLI